MIIAGLSPNTASTAGTHVPSSERMLQICALPLGTSASRARDALLLPGQYHAFACDTLTVCCITHTTGGMPILIMGKKLLLIDTCARGGVLVYTPKRCHSGAPKSQSLFAQGRLSSPGSKATVLHRSQIAAACTGTGPGGLYQEARVSQWPYRLLASILGRVSEAQSIGPAGVPQGSKRCGTQGPTKLRRT